MTDVVIGIGIMGVGHNLGIDVRFRRPLSAQRIVVHIERLWIASEIRVIRRG